MAIEIKVPSVGESITEGTIARWLKSDGEAVRAGDPLFELETEKATTEVPATAAGTLRIGVPEGQTVAIGAVVGRIEEGVRRPQSAPSEEKRVEPASADGAEIGKSDGHVQRAKPVVAAHAQKRPNSETEPALSPAVRRLVAEKGVDVSQVPATGRGGRITSEDVLAFLQRRQVAPPKSKDVHPVSMAPQVIPPAAEAKAPSEARETRQRMSSIRQRIAERLVEAQHSAAILTTFNEADMSAVMALRAKYKDAFRDKHGTGLGLMSFFVKACIEALRSHPAVNARIDGSDVVYHHFYNIGVAVSTEKGLMVPVLRDANQLDFAQIEKILGDLAQKARDGKITVGDLQGGTFTITNGGVFGSLLSTPLLNPPQSATLGMHTIQKRPVAIGDEIAIRPMMYLALSYDHRLIDGREAVGFLIRVKECIESPERMYLEI